MFMEWERLEFMKIEKKEITFRNRNYLLKWLFRGNGG